jgi:hypothetical protein
VRILLALVFVACAPASHPTAGGLAVSGAPLTPEQFAWIDPAHAAVRECLVKNGYRIVDRVEEIRVHSTCRFRPAGYPFDVTGYPVKDRVEVGINLAALRHEFAESLTRNAPGATKACEHAGPRAPFRSCN